jgi:hypothetical protein
MDYMEIRYRIKQCLLLSGAVTMGMLQAFITNRVPLKARNMVLDAMQRDGEIAIETRTFVSITGRKSTAKVIVAGVMLRRAPAVKESAF